MLEKRNIVHVMLGDKFIEPFIAFRDENFDKSRQLYLIIARSMLGLSDLSHRHDFVTGFLKSGSFLEAMLMMNRILNILNLLAIRASKRLKKIGCGERIMLNYIVFIA